MVPVHSFQIDMDSSVVKGNFYGHTCTDPLLMLHGGGRANKNRFSSMRRSLYEKGIFSVAFDFSGCGDSTGDQGPILPGKPGNRGLPGGGNPCPEKTGFNYGCRDEK